MLAVARHPPSSDWVSEEQGVELARILTTALAGGQTDQARITTFRFFHWPKRLGQRCLEVLPSAFIFCEGGRLIHASDGCIHRHGQQGMDTMNGTRQPQSANAASPMSGTGTQNHHQRQEQAQRGGGPGSREV